MSWLVSGRDLHTSPIILIVACIEARWFTRAEVTAVLAHPQGTTIRRQEYQQFDDTSGIKKPMAMAHEQQPPFRVPPRTAVRTCSTHVMIPPVILKFILLFALQIAGVLISDWAAGKYGGGTTTVKGNL